MTGVLAGSSGTGVRSGSLGSGVSALIVGASEIVLAATQTLEAPSLDISVAGPATLALPYTNGALTIEDADDHASGFFLSASGHQVGISDGYDFLVHGGDFMIIDPTTPLTIGTI